MHISTTLFTALLAGIAVGAPATNVTLATNGSAHGPTVDFQDQNPFNISEVSLDFINWKTFKASGANLGGWLEKERTHDPVWWVEVGGGNASDEWTLCQVLGEQCGPIFEARYASFLNTTTIDQLASVGANTLRIPTTYAAWVNVPGSALYHGKQQSHLKTITDYAISKYNMHIVIGLHSLPGGVNSLDIGEGLMHKAWFNNATNLEYSYKAIDAVLDFIQASGHVNAFTLAPINEASDSLAGFGSPAGLTVNGTNWINTYMNGVLDKIAKVDKRIPVMLQDNFMGASYWAPFYDNSTNLVIDSHVYYFAAAGSYSQYTPAAVCGQAEYIAQDTKFPVFVGEWSLQTMYNNTFAGRKTLFDTQRFAWQKFVAGGTFWNAVSYSTDAVQGEGTQRDYWSYIDLINDGVITKATNASYC